MRYLIIFLMQLLCLFASAQPLTQTVRGKLIDRDTKMPLIGAAIVVANSSPFIGSSTDAQGRFRLESVPVGRSTLQLSYMGYDNKTISNVLITSGKEVVLEIEMEESLLQLDEIVVNGGKKKGEVINEMALLSARTFTVDETKRYAGSLSDPSRMVSAFAGVSSNPEGSNDIVVRGNSPTGILWRLEGVDIPNPNHFADEGTTGGPINALNSEMLGNSDFYTGAFSPEYGNVLSGAFDMKLRTGNNEKRECTFGFGVLGTDLTAEGPFKKEYGGSYLVNYRYSSLAILDNAGIVNFDGVPKYQDASFKINLPSKKVGSLSLFGLGGKSGIYETEVDDKDQDIERTNYDAYMGVVGLNHFLALKHNNYLKTSISYSGNGSSWNQKSKNKQRGNFYQDANGDINKKTWSGSINYSHKLNTRNRLLTGITYSHMFYDMSNTYFNEDNQRTETEIDLNKNTGLIKSFASWKHRLNNDITFVGGLHYTNFLLNNAQTLEPRLAMKWRLTPKQSINAGFGMHSKVENIVTYYTVLTDENGFETTPNKDLALTKANHFVLGYKNRLSKNLNAKIELYFQHLYDVPVENIDTSYYSVINTVDGYVDKALVNNGTGGNYGIELTLERYFDNNYYFLFTSSLYQSTYKSLEGKKRNTLYNGNYAFNLLIGKEFKIGKPEKSKTLGLNAKFFYNGGRRYIPIDLASSINKNDNEYHYDKAYEDRLDNVFQMNFSTNYRINRPKVSHEFVLDVQNISNNQARISETYDEYKKTIDYNRQLEIIPNIMYRLHF